MAEERIDALVDIYWKEWDAALEGLDVGGHERLIAAIGAVDTVWDRHLFEHAETFGGAEIGYARALSAAILGRLLGVDYAALASVAGNEIPLTGNETLDEALVRARQEAIDTFSDDLLGPVTVGSSLVYAKPMLLESPVPIGAVVLATREKVTAKQERLLEGFLRHLDTRLDAAEHILNLRRRNLDLEFELKKLKGEIKAPEPVGRVKREAIPENVEQSMAELAKAIPKLRLFGVSLPTQHYADFCRAFDSVTDRYLKILEKAEHLYLAVPSGIDAKDGSKLAAPYLRLLEIMKSLRRAARLLYRVTADELAPFAVGGHSPTFADVTRVAKNLTEDETSQHILEIMNDQGEEAELDALSARSHPYEFRAANTGEVFALLALHQTLKERLPEEFRTSSRPILQALPTYQAAKAYLLSYDQFEDVPLRGVDRTQSPDAEKLLLYRENAPSFGVLLAALSR
ncbi:MAG: hypothetical protein OEV48_11800 [Acidobacteriota bacterium]|jgi:hypothetical protein|nr:hypothetical protein [Acidobacteriota bacterium]